MTPYYTLTGQIDGQTEVIFGSFDKDDVIDERDSLKDQGYRKLTIARTLTNDTPDPEVYS